MISLCRVCARLYPVNVGRPHYRNMYRGTVLNYCGPSCAAVQLAQSALERQDSGA